MSTERPSTVEIKNLLSEIDRTVKILARQIKHPHHYKVYKYQKKRDKIDRNHIDKIEAISNKSTDLLVVGFEQNKASWLRSDLLSFSLCIFE